MNRTYAAKRLLEHGPLTQSEFLEITGWEQRQAARVLQQLLDTQVVSYQYQWAQKRSRCCRTKTRLYALASSGTANGYEHGTRTTPTQPLTTTQGSFHG